MLFQLTVVCETCYLERQHIQSHVVTVNALLMLLQGVCCTYHVLFYLIEASCQLEGSTSNCAANVQRTQLVLLARVCYCSNASLRTLGRKIQSAIWAFAVRQNVLSPA
jgi:hypothetical protein